ncbi:MAG: hypothetical protein ACLP0A_00920 [Verrucomicrobiia bacterium]
MKIYWRCKDIPELANLSRPERRKVWRGCYLEILHFWQFWMGQLAIFIFTVLGDVIGLVLQDRFGVSEAVYYACALAGVLTGCLIDGWIYCTVVIDRLRPYFREYLAANQISH